MIASSEFRISGRASSAIFPKLIHDAFSCAVAWARPTASMSDEWIVDLLTDDLAGIGLWR